jgi:peptide/nickel transport system permease protein
MSEAHSDTFDLKDLYEEDIDPDPESGADRAKRFLEMNVIAPARIAADDWRALVGGAILAFFRPHGHRRRLARRATDER